MSARFSDKERREVLKKISEELGMDIFCTRINCRSVRLSSWRTSDNEKQRGNALYQFRCLDCKHKFTDITLRRRNNESKKIR